MCAKNVVKLRNAMAIAVLAPDKALYKALLIDVQRVFHALNTSPPWPGSRFWLTFEKVASLANTSSCKYCYRC